MSLNTVIKKEDVQQVIKSLSNFVEANFTEEEIQEVIDRYESEQADDPGANWSLVVEKILYDLLDDRNYPDLK
jgi:hypothetical protein